MGELENEKVPGLDDWIKLPTDERIARYESYLRDRCDFETLLRMAAENAILLKDAIFERDSARCDLEWQKESNEVAVWGLELGTLVAQDANATRDRLKAVSKELAEKKSKHSKAGAKGGEAKALRQEPLKQWAIEEGRRLKGNPTERARKLMKRLTDSLAALSEDPERVMREAIRKDLKNA